MSRDREVIQGLIDLLLHKVDLYDLFDEPAYEAAKDYLNETETEPEGDSA